jgi:SAM-dependent methyltransferase
MYAVGSFFMIKALYATEDRLVEAFRTGEGVGWGEHDAALFEGTAAFFRPGYAAALVPEWLPAMPGVVEKLERGARVADVGCGHGHSTLLMADAFPNSTFHGYDFHAPSIEAARANVAEQKVTFDVATAQDFPGGPYDLITFFDCLHDLGDPEGALRRAEQMLAADGTVMIVEPNASPNLLDNRNPIGRSFSSSSVAVCLPSALAQHGPQALGNHAGEGAMRTLAERAGLTDWRLGMETLANRVYAVKRG